MFGSGKGRACPTFNGRKNESPSRPKIPPDGSMRITGKTRKTLQNHAHHVPDLVANKLVQVFAKWIDAPQKAWLYMFAIAAMTAKDWAAPRDKKGLLTLLTNG